MSDFDPGEGWREVPEFNGTDGFWTTPYVMNMTNDGPRFWVREKPVPPLPIEPYTVIRVTWKSSHQQRTRPRHVVRMSEEWYEVSSSQGVSSEALLKQITGFEVLASPTPTVAQTQLRVDQIKMKTAKAVLDLVKRDVDFGMAGSVLRERLNKIAHTFGIDN